MAEWIIFIAAVIVPSLIIAFGPALIYTAEEIAYRARPRRSRPVSDDDWNDQNPPKSLNYNYIDWLERDLKVGKYDPDRIALGFDDTEPKPKPRAFEVNERCPCIACRSMRRDAKPVDDSWADVDDGEWAEIPADDVDTDIIQAFGMGMVRKTYRR